MSPLPAKMVNRWQDRHEPRPDEGTVYWHILVGDHPEARDLAQTAQSHLADFSGLHFTPTEWLHITTLVAGSTDDITDEHQQAMLTAASEQLANIPPITVTLGRIYYHPEAIAFAVEPRGQLQPVRDAAQAATTTVLGHQGHTEGPAQWTPHMTIVYSEAEQPAEPLITALGHQLPEHKITINALTLVVQRGAERLWDWHPVGRALLLGDR